MDKPLKIIQIGVGGWGWSWVGIIKRSPDFELAGIVDISNVSLEKACENYELNKSIAFTDLSQAVRETKADAALIVVPPDGHMDTAIMAMQNGLHCMIEKPLAPNIQDAKAIVEAAEKYKLKLMVSQNYRFKRAPRTVKHVIGRGTIGEIGTVFINFQKAPVFTGFRAEMDEPLITDMAIHHFDQIRGTLGLEPVKITAFSWNPKWSYFKGNPIASVLFEMENGAILSYIGSWASTGWETTWDGDWHIQGDGGEIHWANNQVTVKPTDLFKTVYTEGALEKDGHIQVDLLNLPQEERVGTLSEFARSILENREPETSGRDNLRSLAMVLGAAKSAKTHETILIDEMI